MFSESPLQPKLNLIFKETPNILEHIAAEVRGLPLLTSGHINHHHHNHEIKKYICSINSSALLIEAGPICQDDSWHIFTKAELRNAATKLRKPQHVLQHVPSFKTRGLLRLTARHPPFSQASQLSVSTQWRLARRLQSWITLRCSASKATSELHATHGDSELDEESALGALVVLLL